MITGELKSKDEFDGDPSDYGIALNKHLVLDARSTQSALGRYANSCRRADQQAGHCRGNNARIVHNSRNHTVRLRAVKTIPANDEVFIAYGRQFWAGN